MIYIYYTPAAEAVRRSLGLSDFTVYRRSHKWFQKDPETNAIRGTLGSYTHLNVKTLEACTETGKDTFIYVWEQVADRKHTAKIHDNKMNAQDLPVGRIILIVLNGEDFTVTAKEVFNRC
jgi:hypothetical protein